MEFGLSAEDKKRIKEGIGQKYAKVAESPEGLFSYPTGRAGLEALRYDPEIIQALPEAAVESYCGVGNPFSLGPILKGEAVLDIGCGGGVDTLIAAMMAGPAGKAVGVDMIPEMLERAKKNLKEEALENIKFEEASAEALPFSDGSFDVVISNGVFNLIPDKAKALREVFRVLKHRGRFMIADQVLTGDLPQDSKARVNDWFK
jgi:SAM-dependent methyltransferase